MNKYNVRATSAGFGDPVILEATMLAENAKVAEDKVRTFLTKNFNFNSEVKIEVELCGDGGLKLWVDDVREPPSKDWLWAKSVMVAKEYLASYGNNIKLVSLDHDAGDYAQFGGDYVNILNWLEEVAHNGAHINIVFHIHSMNPVGKFNMLNIIEKNHWKWQLWLDGEEATV